MTYRTATIIVPAASVPHLRLLAAYLGRDMEGMFTVGLSATGAAPATHFVSSGHVPRDFIRYLRNPTMMRSAAQAAWQARGEAFPYTQAQITAHLAACIVVAGTAGTDEPFPETGVATLGRLGLRHLESTP